MQMLQPGIQVAMQDQSEFRGSYQYATLAQLDVALDAARAQLDSPACDDDIEWLDCFSREGTTLYVHATLPTRLNGFFTASVLRALATTAKQGAIEVRLNGAPQEFLFVESIARRDDFGDC
jgi:hypothetical protein